jgi:7-carboxy-7-deazaguanine synthase
MKETPVKISEIFFSIQGEGLHIGIPMVFVRFQGCNLLTGCNWCDTKYARRDDGEHITVGEVVSEVSRLQPFYKGWVCITGGEPLFQDEALEALVRTLREGKYKIEIETNGTLEKPNWYTLVDSWVADIKTPSSGVPEADPEILKDWVFNRPWDQIKMVVANDEDLDYAREIIKRFPDRQTVTLISPCIGCFKSSLETCWLKDVAEFCKEHRVRMSLQLHKIIWGNKRGV